MSIPLAICSKWGNGAAAMKIMKGVDKPNGEG